MLLQFSIKLHLAKHATVLVAVSLGRCKVLAQGSCAASEGSGRGFGALGQLLSRFQAQGWLPGTAESSLNPNTGSKCHLVAVGHRIEET